MIASLRKYYWLAKPGIVFSNVISAMAGFFLASSHKGELAISLLLAVTVGIALIIASACVLNNYIDRGIDAKMKRTKWRVVALKDITKKEVYLYTALLGTLGFGILFVTTNFLSFLLGLIAYFAYIVLYGIAKRRTIHGTLVGTISGAIPPALGYVAVTNTLDMGALLLFLVLVCWQMAHFYAIAMRRHGDYKAAKLPVMPVVKGMRRTKVQILFYIALFATVNELFVAFGYTKYVYIIVMTVLSGVWFVKGLRGFDTEDDQKWAKQMFGFSLVVLLTLCPMLALGGLLP